MQNENLKAELHDLAREMELAKGREMEHVNNVYKKLHDLDYFLLRYGPEVFENSEFRLSGRNSSNTDCPGPPAFQTYHRTNIRSPGAEGCREGVSAFGFTGK